MKIIDLTHTVSPDMPVYPGTEQPSISQEFSIEHDGFIEKKITMVSHTGTHVEAPAHLILGAKTLDQLPVERFYGKAVLLSIIGLKTPLIGFEEIEPYLRAIKQSEFVLVRTGWATHWGTEQYFRDYPIFSTEAAAMLSSFKLKGIGIDTISLDLPEGNEFPIHTMFLKNGSVIIENLTNLEHLPPGVDFVFSCLPIKFEQADGSPVRAVAVIN
jgi:kynurenine formamidase